jgi:broad specificity phosphatase PhoE
MVFVHLTRNILKCFGNLNKTWKEDNAPDPLTGHGKSQAENLGKSWEDVRIDHLLSSPLERAYDTAKALSENNKGHPMVLRLHQLVERKYGQKAARLMRQGYHDEAHKVLSGNDPYDRFHSPDEGGESLNAVAERGAKAITGLINGFGVDLSEPPEFFRTKERFKSPMELPAGIPHVVIVSHNVFLCELYDKLKNWGETYGMSSVDYRNTGW